MRDLESEVVSCEATSLKVATELGPMVVYPHHASLIGSIPFSRLSVRQVKSEKDYLLRNGILFVSLEKNSVTILCYACELIQDIEYQSAREYLQFIEEKLKRGEDLNAYQLTFLNKEKIAMVQQLKALQEK